MSALKVFLQNIDAFLVPFIAHVGTLHDSCSTISEMTFFFVVLNAFIVIMVLVH